MCALILHDHNLFLSVDDCEFCTVVNKMSSFSHSRDGFFESHELLTKTAKELEAMGNSPPSSHHVSSQMLRATGLSMSSINPANLSKDDLKTLRQHVKESMGRTHIKLQGSDGEPW